MHEMLGFFPHWERVPKLTEAEKFSYHPILSSALLPAGGLLVFGIVSHGLKYLSGATMQPKAWQPKAWQPKAWQPNGRDRFSSS